VQAPDSTTESAQLRGPSVLGHICVSTSRRYDHRPRQQRPVKSGSV